MAKSPRRIIRRPRVGGVIGITGKIFKRQQRIHSGKVRFLRRGAGIAHHQQVGALRPDELIKARVIMVMKELKRYFRL